MSKKNTVYILIGTNLKTDAPILNSALKKRYIAGNFEVYHLGSSNLETFPSLASSRFPPLRLI